MLIKPNYCFLVENEHNGKKIIHPTMWFVGVWYMSLLIG